MQTKKQKNKMVSGRNGFLPPTPYALRPNPKRGALLVEALIFGFIAAIIIAGLVYWVGINLLAARTTVASEQAFQIAEAGIDYYRWHLAKIATDFQDGTGLPGPYTHVFKDTSGATIGQFVLEITPPGTGSTQVKVKSTGTITSDSSVSRSVEVISKIPTVADFALVSNSLLRIGVGTEVYGLVHANNGIRFDGLAHNVVSSKLATYNDPDHEGGDEFGVHTHVFPVDPALPAAVPVRSDVFLAGRQFPVSEVQFSGFTTDLEEMEDMALAGGLHLDAIANKQGFHLVLKANDTVDIYVVDTLLPTPQNCPSNNGQSGWGTWTIEAETFLRNEALPMNGIIFAADHVWVDGTIDGARLTIGAGRFPENQGQGKSITINDNLLYTNYDGTDSIGLVAQENVTVGLVSADTLRIDGALVAKNGRVGRYYYKPPVESQIRCSPYHVRQALTLYGMFASNQRYGFSYADTTGYIEKEIIYDPYLFYAPPPSFPVISDDYNLLGWREVTH